MAGSGSIGTDAYTRMINEKLIQLDTRFAIDNQYTPLIGDYSGLRGGTRKQQFITPGISGSQYPLNYPESYAISAGVMRRGPARPVSTISPVNSVYPTIMPMSIPMARGKGRPSIMPLMDELGNVVKLVVGKGRNQQVIPMPIMDNVVRLPMGRNPSTYTPKKQGGKRRSTKGMMSLTMPGLEDYTTKKSSMYHDVGGHYVKSLPRPYSGGGLPSLADIGRSISSGIKKVGSQITSGVNQVENKIVSGATQLGNQIASGATKVGNQIASGATQVGNQIVTDYKNASPEFKMVARQILPTVGSAVGASLGSALGTFAEPGMGTFVGEQLGSYAGNQLGQYATRKIGLGRKKKGPVKTPKKQGGARSGSRQDLVKQIMKQHGVSLPVASKYIKENNLY